MLSISTNKTYVLWKRIFQEFYLELRRLKKHAEDHFIDLDWLTYIIKELIEAILLWISREEIWEVSKEHLSEQTCGNFIQVFLVSPLRIYLSEQTYDMQLEQLLVYQILESPLFVILKEFYTKIYSESSLSKILKLNLPTRKNQTYRCAIYL